MPDFAHEQAYWQQQFCHVAGVDEAGRGCLAGPVVAAAVVFPPEPDLARQLPDLNDSKKLSPRQREALFPRIQSLATSFAVGIVAPEVIDRINILQASLLAMQQALEQLPQVDVCLIDGNRPLKSWPGRQQTLVKGDQRSLSVAAASVLAKVTRDRLMLSLDQDWPLYGFSRHKGYPTALHIQQLQIHGASPHHRLSFCRKFLECA